MSRTTLVLRFTRTMCPPIRTCAQSAGGGGSRRSSSSGQSCGRFWSPKRERATPHELLFQTRWQPISLGKPWRKITLVVVVITAFTVFIVIPFGPTHAVTDMNIGILFMLGVSSLGVLGIMMAGWASNSHYPLMGALRSSSQMVSYEIAMGLAVISVVLMTSFTGPIARGLSLVSIVVGGVTFAFGEGGSKRLLAGIVFGVGMAIGAVNFMAWLFP